jgi:cellulose synthase (UDP-forming)
VRTRALQAVGGLGPELAEDHSTTLLLSAGGWKGAFALDAIAHGDGPATLADFLTQEFQWCRSLVNVLLTVTPRVWSRLTPRLRVQFAFCQLWYIGLASAMVLGYAIPVVAIVTGVPWVRVELWEFYLHASLLMGASMVVGAWVRKQGWFRPKNAPLVSWEDSIMQLLKWPWIAMGVAYAVVDSLLKKEFAFKVTPKGAAGAHRLPLVAIAPYLLIAVAEGGAATLAGLSSRPHGYQVLALLYCASFLVATAVAVVQHLRENPAYFTSLVGGLRPRSRPAVAGGALAGGVPA